MIIFPFIHRLEFAFLFKRLLLVSFYLKYINYYFILKNEEELNLNIII